MNRLAWVLGAAALVWCAILTWNAQTGAKGAMSAELQSGQAAVVAYVHGDSLQLGYDYIRLLEDQILSVAERVQLRVDSLVMPLREEAQELITYAQSDAATQEEIAVASQRLGELEQQVNALQGQQQQYLANLEQQLQSQVAARLTTELEAYAAETGIDVIVNWGLSGEGVLYGAEPFNITQPLLAFLNERVERPQLDAEEVPELENDGE